MGDANSVVVVLTTGKQDRGTRATLAFGWACAALALGKDVSVYLTMDGTMWAMRGAAASVQVEGFEPLDEYVSQFTALGGKLLVCAPCSEYYCSFDRSLVHDKLLPEANVVGLTTVVGKIGAGTSVVSF